jgi:hypothetical protein
VYVSIFAEHLESQTKLARNSRSVDHNEFKSRMGTFRAPGRTRRWTPEFVFNDAQLRCVLMHATVGFCFRSGTPPQEVLSNLEKLKELAARRQDRERALAADDQEISYWNKLAQTINARDQAGGFMQVAAGISFRAWRLNWHDDAIAAEMELTAEAVKKIRHRLLDYGRRLGFATYVPRRDKARKLIDLTTIQHLHSLGADVFQIAKTLQCSARAVQLALNVERTCPKCGSRYEQSKQHRICRKCTRKYQAAFARKRREEAWLKTVAWG